ncbi:hypothetical protein NP233_g1835 [Leucocoprinus birnbaumii]|uniref:non-specific serine/threonine protein kinase n=1 Tax=Leucocoprinus birnbaumii TaxID=56174 RepID=A0AAD5W395_9AGAR|nr:hypothetical protein NP233_g1835 [Leucocoprinus birnbaumii]
MSDSENDIPEIFPASKLGEYTVIRDVAEGTFGKVKMGQHTVTGHVVAMKYISKAVIHREKTKTRVRREYEYMRTLRHPHVIKLYEVISTPTDIIFVMEFAGGELFNYIVANGRMPESRARKFFQQIISGIEFSHRLKIVHRDLKPENILLDDDLNVKITDFGLSNEMSDGDFLATSCGSPNYAAPEVIRGGVYAGPEIDVWSAGVILYVMLSGRLPFEDDDVHMLFSKITQGSFHIPSSFSNDARNLISAMLVVDPVKRITIPEILQHPFFTKDLPRYLSPLPIAPEPVSMTALVAPPKQLDFEIIEGLGKIEPEVVEELASRLADVTKEDIWASLRRDDGVQGNAVKVSYLLLRDKKRGSKGLAALAEAERDAQMAAMDPRNAILSPSALSPGGNDAEDNPFEAEFNGDYDETDSPEYDFMSPPIDPDNPHANTFAVLDSSLPVQLPEQHHLASYASAKRSGATNGKEKRQRTKWHFGIRSRSPPMEVMLEIYRTLKALGMEWKEKRNLGGLGGVKARRGSVSIERAREYDGNGYVDLKAASGIYFVETRARIQDVVVMMNLQLYMVDSINYLVDFHHKKSYRASTEPGAGKFDMAVNDHGGFDDELTRKEKDGQREDEVVSPYVFMDVACRLILELAGGAE